MVHANTLAAGAVAHRQRGHRVGSVMSKIGEVVIQRTQGATQIPDELDVVGSVPQYTYWEGITNNERDQPRFFRERHEDLLGAGP